ncbi:ATPase [Pelomonas sp. HMWF004]|nr:ATPase [Pelomonas sp. HMWF004]
MNIANVAAGACLLIAAVAFAGAQSQSNKPLDDFHAKVVKMGGDAAMNPDVQAIQNPHVKPYAAIVNAARWPSPNIPVCWENPSSASADAMAWVKDAVKKTWSSVSALKFTGWTKCATVNKGIRIQIAEEGPHVKNLGRLIDGKPKGMVLNFTFANWSQSCQAKREFCIRAIAVHEFGHAVGFTHEQNRADAPGECKMLAQGTSPDTMLTPYDPTSAMNYCNKDWNNNGILSALDAAAAIELYGKPTT